MRSAWRGLAGMMDLDGEAGSFVQLESLTNGFGLAYKHHMNAVFGRSKHSTLDFHYRSVIAPHCVDCDFRHGIPLFFGGLYDFTAFVISAVRTDTMRQS